MPARLVPVSLCELCGRERAWTQFVEDFIVILVKGCVWHAGRTFGLPCRAHQ